MSTEAIRLVTIKSIIATNAITFVPSVAAPRGDGTTRQALPGGRSSP